MRRLMIHAGWLAGMSACTQAFAQSTAAGTEGTLEEVIVTAERREQTLQETALTVSVVSGKEIARTGLSTFNDVLERTPGVQMQFQPTPANGPTIAIRGIGTDAIPNKQSATAIYEDGIRSYRLDNYFYDIARVEVLKGPQGTLYGGNATGGAVSVISNDPKLGEFEGSASAEAGNYNMRHMQGMLNVPASDTLSFRLAGNWQTRDQYSGSDAPKGQDSLNFRGKALWQPNDDFSLLAGAEYYRDKGLGRNSMAYVDANANLDETFAEQAGRNFIEVRKYFLNLNLDVGIGRLTYIPAVQYAELEQVYLSPPMTDDAMPDGKLVTHEMRLASDADSFISWVVGAYYYDEKSINTTTVYLGPLGDIVTIDDNHNRQIASFGQVTIPLSDTWRLTGGARYSDDEVAHPQTQTFPPIFGIPGGTTPFEKNFHHLDYLGRIEHDLTPDNLLYASLSTGYRPGNLAVNGQAYGNETVKAYEIGSKNVLLDSSLVLNAAVFYYKYSGFQIANDESCGPGCLTFGMASVPADFVGAELDLTWRLTPNDTLTVQPSYLRGRFTDDFLARQSIFDPYTAVTADGETLPHAPEWRLNANYQHDFPLSNDSRLFVRGEAAYVSEQFTDFSACIYAAPDSAQCSFGADTAANHTQDDYTLVNLSAGYSAPHDRWSVTAYVRNLTDEIYKLNYTRVAGAVFVGAPRTYGVVVSTKW